LKEPYSQILQTSLRNLDNAFKRFFHKKSNFPKFKKKNSINSIQYPQNAKINCNNSKLILPKCGNIKIILHRKFNGKIKTVTISKTPTNKYFASIIIDDNKLVISKKKFDETNSIGIDVGIRNFITTSNGNKIENPKYLEKSINKINILQNKLLNKKYGSKNWNKSRIKLAKQYEKIKNQRYDFLHKLSSKLISNNQAIIIEDLDIISLISKQNKYKLSKQISDASWRCFIMFLEYKAKYNGKNILKINRFDPSSKMCSTCGWINNKLKLSDEKWKCKKCNTIHDRDTNAAKNIKNFYLIKPRLGRPVEPV